MHRHDIIMSLVGKVFNWKTAITPIIKETQQYQFDQKWWWSRRFGETENFLPQWQRISVTKKVIIWMKSTWFIKSSYFSNLQPSKVTKCGFITNKPFWKWRLEERSKNDFLPFSLLYPKINLISCVEMNMEKKIISLKKLYINPFCSKKT